MTEVTYTEEDMPELLEEARFLSEEMQALFAGHENGAVGLALAEMVSLMLLYSPPALRKSAARRFSSLVKYAVKHHSEREQ